MRPSLDRGENCEVLITGAILWICLNAKQPCVCRLLALRSTLSEQKVAWSRESVRPVGAERRDFTTRVFPKSVADVLVQVFSLRRERVISRNACRLEIPVECAVGALEIAQLGGFRSFRKKPYPTLRPMMPC